MHRAGHDGRHVSVPRRRDHGNDNTDLIRCYMVIILIE
jgi:hypothetical protein